jgi:hypothetical protein
MMPAYSVYCRCLSAVRLPPGDAVRFVNPDGPFPSVEVRSRYMPAPAQEVALDLLIETRLRAPDLEAAVNEGLQAANSHLLGLTVAANAYAANPVLVAAYEVDPGVAERDWIQSYQPPEHPIPPNARQISREAAGELMRAADQHHCRSQFADKDSALLALVYLNIAAETLTPVLRDLIRDEWKLSDEQMFLRFGVNEAASDKEKVLLSRIRLHEIYDGDNKLRRKVEQVSNGFEHGGQDLVKARESATLLLATASKKVRRAILSAARLPRAILEQLASEEFSVPLPLFAIEYLYLGKLRVSDESLLAPGTEPVQGLRNWSAWVESSDRQPDGNLVIVSSGRAHRPHDGCSVEVKGGIQRLPGTLGTKHCAEPIEIVDEEDDVRPDQPEAPVT